ncbi:TPA: fimbrial protein [Klebsiella oxytoca]|nr:fimbrial protein [Klebsiella oxytoca]
MRLRCFVLTAAILPVLLSVRSVQAVTNESAARFHGTVIVVECSINGAKRQTVDFGTAVGIKRIDGKRYEQPVPFSVNCTNYAGGDVPTLTLVLGGNTTSFNDAAVATDVNGLGIELRNNGKAQPLNKAVTFDYKNVPILTAVPVADPSVSLSAQPFTATVKLTVEVA